MAEQIGKNKIVLLGLAALLLVSCGGGGGGSSNTPVIPSNSEKPIVNKVENIVNPSNPGNGTSPSPSAISGNNPTQNESRESLESLRARMDETKVREYILNEQKNSTETIPTDTIVRNGSEVKVGVLDGDFITRRVYLKNKYDNIEILDRDIAPKTNDHGELVLTALREKNKLGIVAGSIGANVGSQSSGVMPTLDSYNKVLAKFDPNQKVKVFSQSWGVAESIGSFKTQNDEYRMRAISSTNSSEDGRKILDFYREQVNKDTLFIWANGNTAEDAHGHLTLFNDAIIKVDYHIFILT